MTIKPLEIYAEWDCDAGVWVVSSDDIHGLVIEAPTLQRARERLPGVLADLVELGESRVPPDLDPIPFTLRVTRHINVRS